MSHPYFSLPVYGQIMSNVWPCSPQITLDRLSPYISKLAFV